MRVLKLFSMGALIILAGCSQPADRYTVAPVEVDRKIPIGFASVEIRDVSLPAYAAADEIPVGQPDGRISSSGALLWADTPERSISLALSRNLAILTGKTIASEPWPLEFGPDARVELRFDQLIAGHDGMYRASGQYFVGTLDSRGERSGQFDLSQPYLIDAGPEAIAQARAKIILDLAAYIAEKGLR